MAISKTKAREQRISTMLAKYNHSFDITMSAIDLREMSKNFPQGIIPSIAVTEVVNAVLGPAPKRRLSVDPRELNIPMFIWAPMDDVCIDSIFQRDIIPRHVNDIEYKFVPDMIIVPCAIKDPSTGKYLLWDGNHTRQVCDRMGWSHLPVWYTEADINDITDIQEATKILKRKAGMSFLVTNKTGKEPLRLYDDHMISVDCDIADSVIIQNIVDANGCRVSRTHSKPGDITHIVNLRKSYNLTQSTTGIKGIYLSRALKFHRTTWPKEEIVGIMMLALARLYELTDRQTGVLLPQAFDTEFGSILRTIHGFSGAVFGDEKTGLKGAFIEHFGSIGDVPRAITSGLILTYNKHGKQGFKLGQPEDTFTVK